MQGTRVEEPTKGRFDSRPLLVFWEMTKACQLACFHCRADAQLTGGPDELSTREGVKLIDSIAALGRPRPILILTGGDCLMRDDIVELASYAHSLNVPVAIAPSVTEKLTSSTLEALRGAGVKSASLSLDGANASTHDAVRGVPGHFDATLRAIAELKRHGFTTQINTTVMASNVRELADVAQLLHEFKVDVWEVFFLITTGRGSEVEATSAKMNEEVCHFLVNASRYGFTVRTVEAPFFRRVALDRHDQDYGGDPAAVGETYEFLRSRLLRLLGPSSAPIRTPSAATRDGKGIIFVGANGDIYPSGFLPIALGNVRTSNLIDVYRDHDVLRSIRSADFVGPCRSCDHADLCGGSRSRAYATYENALASDPGCVLVSSSSL
ncbi:MAG TPA: TIGR04053 family radical SAM/SPASM domain-containing protein [Acidimicrobiales bacterium]|nr:TIGR04053 family radical SAM/SPASM domain-containing protein [Acidimicrobiales bacterium]